MASGSEFTRSNDHRKRRRVQTQRKLLVDDHVEVRSEEEGFAGSWHSAVVVACGDGYREVKYVSMVDDDGYSPIFERVKVSPAMEGLTVEFDQFKYRGFIRPVPPVVEFGLYSIPYGSCVDVSYNDAWWEGVVFDNEDGATKRKVFFPDLGDEMDVDISDIRITQEWNEVSEEWLHRGIWYFLEVAEEFERQFLSVCSIQQLWYNVREKEGFKKVGEWTSSDRVMWNELVAEAISDCTDDYLEQVFSSIDMPSEPTVDNSLTAGLTNCSNVVPFDASERTSGDGPAEHDDFSSGAVGSDLSSPITESTLEETALVGLDCLKGINNLNTKMSAESCMFSHEKILSTVPDQSLDANAFTAIRRYPCADESMMNEKLNHSSRKYGLYLPHEHNKLPGQRYFPNIIEEYLHAFVGNKMPRPSLTTKVRMHLSFCGWRMDQMKDKGGTLRKRYISPDGKPYQSLRQACLNFIEPSVEIVSSAQINPEDTHFSPSDAISPLILDEPRNIEHKKLPGKKFVPSIIEEYLHAFGGKNKPKPSLTTNLKRHLSSCGWRIEPMKHKDGRPRTRYTSPAGKSYQSLRIACLSFKEPSTEIISSDRINSEDTHFSPVDAISPMILDEPKEIEDSDYSPMPPVPLNSNMFDVEPEYCPQAVLDYVNIETKKERNSDMCSIRLRAKKHLVATGWELSYREGKGKLVLRYLSPTNKSYYALVRACKACIKEGNADRDASAYRPIVCINGNAEEVPSGDFSAKCLPPPPTSFRETIRGRRSSRVSRELVQWGNFKIQKNRKSRTYGTKHKSQRVQSHSSKNGAQADVPASNNRSVSGSVGKYELRTLDDQGSNSHRSKRRKAVSNIPANALRYRKIERQVAIPSSSLYDPLTELSWLIDNSVVLPMSRVYYSGRKDHNPVKEGRIIRNGIKCKCCRNLFSLRGFQAHAGSEYQMPCAHIFLEDGRSLLDCQKQVVINDIKSCANMSTGLQQGENDSICSICHYGGDLILCDHCPSSFHINCVGLKNVPDGEWFCASCCCGICGQRKQEGNENLTDDTIICVQCEHKYHAECLKRAGGFMLDEYPMKGWVCGKKCKKIFLSLHKLLGRRISVDAENLSWTLLKSVASESPDPDANVEAFAENYIKLKVALDVMHECFESVKEPYTGKDLIENVVFSNRSNLNRLNFCGFYTALLEKDDELVTVANVRIYGEKVAEVPLIGTRFQFRRLGMCRILMNELEKKLRSIGVERLILPAIPSMLNAWTTSFGFSQMTDSERLQYLSYTFLDFQATIMCHKILSENPSADRILQIEAGPKCELDVSGNGGNLIVGFNGSSPGSEVFQAEQFENIQTVEWGMLELPGSGNCDNSGRVQQLVAVNETTHGEDAVMETHKNTCIKYYVRRKKQLVGV